MVGHPFHRIVHFRRPPAIARQNQERKFNGGWERVLAPLSFRDRSKNMARSKPPQPKLLEYLEVRVDDRTCFVERDDFRLFSGLASRGNSWKHWHELPDDSFIVRITVMRKWAMGARRKVSRETPRSGITGGGGHTAGPVGTELSTTGRRSQEKEK
jgi:hypothetical protein